MVFIQTTQCWNVTQIQFKVGALQEASLTWGIVNVLYLFNYIIYAALN